MSLLAVGVAAYSIEVAHQDRPRDTRYSIRAQIRDVTLAQQRFGLSTHASPAQVLEYRSRLHNWGNVDAKDVTLDATVPAASAGREIAGSCRVKYPDHGEQRCDDSMDERHLHLSSLHADQTIELKFRFTTRLPPCDGYRAQATFTARSADRTALSDTATAYISRERDRLECQSDDAALMELIPLAYRDHCYLSKYDPVVGSSAAHIACAPPGSGVQSVQYYLFRSVARAQAAFHRRLVEVGRGPRRQCGVDPDGEGYQNYTGRSTQEIHYLCWRPPGTAEAWIELVNRRYKLFVAVHRVDTHFRALFKWANDNTP